MTRPENGWDLASSDGDLANFGELQYVGGILTS
jgi:hypothetical protein